MSKKYKIFLAGAGTGGHVLTALSVYKALLKKDPSLKDKILFVGSINLRKGMEDKPSLEEKLCKEQGVNFAKIRTGKVQRFLTWRTIRLLLQIPLGFWDAFWLVVKNRPKVVFASGGYVTPPVLFWAKVFGAKTFLHEQTMAPGLASRVSAYFADKILISFKQSIRHFKPKLQKKVIYTGYPVQRDIFDVNTFDDLLKLLKDTGEIKNDTQDYLKELENLENAQKLYNKPVLFVTGGSTGAHVINEVIYKNLPDLLEHFVVFVQTGDSTLYNDFDKFVQYKQNLQDKGANENKLLIVQKFLAKEMGYVLKKADFVIARSGAGTVYQLGMLGKRSILIPLPKARNNEQYKNALLLKNLGIAKIIKQDKWLEIDNLAQLLLKELENLSSAIKANAVRKNNTYKTKQFTGLFPLNADEKIASLILKALK